MKKQLTESEFYNAWLKYHNTTIEQLLQKEPELMKTVEWFKKYAVTPEQHDEWYTWAVERIKKHNNVSKKRAEKIFAFDYLNVAPMIKE